MDIFEIINAKKPYFRGKKNQNVLLTYHLIRFDIRFILVIFKILFLNIASLNFFNKNIKVVKLQRIL